MSKGDPVMASSLAVVLFSFAATYIFLRLLLTFTHGAKEPVAVATGIPFVSPLIGMAKKTKFYKDLRDKYNLPIYTLRLPGSRIYVVNSTSLIPSVQRQARVLDFAPIEVRAAINVMGASPEGSKIIEAYQNGLGDCGYAIEFGKAIHPALTPGPSLDAMNKLSIANVAEVLDNLTPTLPKKVKLFGWAQGHMAWATSEAVYGPDNPFRDPEILDAFWKFEPGIVVLLLQFFPSIFARESLHARNKVADAFLKYFRNGGHERGSELIRARYDHSINYKISVEDIARFEVGGAVAVLTNTIPTTFWMLWHLISDVDTRESCRKELDRLCRVEKDTVSIDITEVKTSCPLLLSILQEALRLHGTGISVRVVQQDHLLDGQYFLKKGSTLMIPGPVQHFSKAVYGDNVNEFNPRRFMRTEGKRPNPVGFRGFGGGTTLCPGRHFVSTEIIAFVALMILRFEIRSVSGEWIQPTTHKAGMQATVPPPDTDVEVEISLRDSELAGKKWKVLISTSSDSMGIVAEDNDQSR